jgi:tRNA (guanine37-N1)-methyltransferase
MKFDIITIFPEIFNSFLKESLIARAQKKGLIKINIHNLRKWTTNKHKNVDPIKSHKAGSPKAKFNRVDDRPYGGGLGMVIKIEPIYRCVQFLKSKIKNPAPTSGAGRGQKSKIILFTPRGKQFNQKIAYKLSKLDRIIMICGRYEGIDERVAKHIADIELSIGPYDLMGGELPAMIVMETIARLIPGVISKPEILKERITKEKGFIEYPQYTRPPKFLLRKKLWRAGPEIWKVPKVLLSGNHKKIDEWRKKHQKIIE